MHRACQLTARAGLLLPSRPCHSARRYLSIISSRCSALASTQVDVEPPSGINHDVPLCHSTVVGLGDRTPRLIDNFAPFKEPSLPPSAFDLRSDVVTSPTARMLAAIASAPLLDDVYQEDSATNSLEALIANLTGKESALLVTSGTMGNQVSIRTALQAPPHSVLTDHRSHILEWEAGGIAAWCGALLKGITPANPTHLTLEDLQDHAVLSDDIHFCPTKLISLENTLDGMILPLAECQRIATWAHQHGIWLHLDGARLWEAVAAGTGSLADYCACFDSVSLCFSKGLGAPIGSIIVGTEAFCKRARHIRKTMGGGLRQSGWVTAPARVAVEDTFLGGKLVAGHARAKEVERMWRSLGGQTVFPVQTNMVWLDLEAAGIAMRDLIEQGRRLGLSIQDERLVFHYQTCDDAIERLGRLMQSLMVKS